MFENARPSSAASGYCLQDCYFFVVNAERLEGSKGTSRAARPWHRGMMVRGRGIAASNLPEINATASRDVYEPHCGYADPGGASDGSLRAAFHTLGGEFRALTSARRSCARSIASGRRAGLARGCGNHVVMPPAMGDALAELAGRDCRCARVASMTRVAGACRPRLPKTSVCDGVDAC